MVSAEPVTNYNIGYFSLIDSSRAVNHPEEGKLFKLRLKHQTLHKLSLGHKEQIQKRFQNF